MFYEIDKFYEFNVIDGGSPESKFFILEVEGPQGKSTVQLPKISFQRDPKRPAYEKITCRVKSIGDDGLPVLSHALSSYVYELHKDAFLMGQLLETQVVGIPSKPAEEPFTVRDSFGILYRLFDREGLLTKGQIVKCKFTKLAPTYFEIERVDEGANMPYFSPEFLCDSLDLTGALRHFIIHSFLATDALGAAAREIAEKNPLWILTAARTIQQKLPEWLLKGKNGLKRRNRACMALLECARNVCLFLIEGSNFLNAVAVENRRSLQQQFTDIIDSLDPYFTILDLIREAGEVKFVERLLDKLQRSGYLYHPARQFSVMMLIFRMDPDKVSAYVNRIFESIFSRDLENWKREPFRSAFVEQFDIYVNQMRNEIDALPMAESREQKLKIETVITAIALQSILAPASMRLERSMSLFYRYIALLRPESTDNLLAKSFLALMGVPMGQQMDYKHLKQPMMMMTKATVMPEGDFMRRISSTHLFCGQGIDIEISADGIILTRPGHRAMDSNIITEAAMPWLRPQILLDGVRQLPKSSKIAEHKRWWKDVETALLETKSAPVVRPDEPRVPEPGEYVYITVNGVDDRDSNNPTFLCTVHDDGFKECPGTLRREDIVGYNLRNPNMNSFRSLSGDPLGYYARVIGRNPDGSLRFSLLEEVEAFMAESMNFEDEYLAVVASPKNPHYNTQMGICRLGFGVTLQLDGDEAYPNGSHVLFRRHENSMTSAIGAQSMFKITRVSDNPAERFDKAIAFFDLMQALGVEAEGSESSAGESDESMVRDIDELLTPDEIREVIGILRLHVFSQSDILAAYDYLRFAAIMAAVIGDDALRLRLETHAELIALHQFFATNSSIDKEALEKLRIPAMADQTLAMVFHRLEMVSWLGDTSHNADLFDCAAAPQSDLEGTVARMVLAANLLDGKDGDDKPVVPQIRKLLMSRLNVNSETPRAKYYGSESKFLEFKTSLVFPATGRGEQMKTDPVAQQNHILSRIAGMLNADGGRLYIGVNDQGYEVGMHDDFEYYRRQNVFDGKASHRIGNIADLCKFLELLINNRFEKKAARRITVSADSEAAKGVVEITIEESLEPVFLDGRLYVRQSGEVTQEYHGAEIMEFENERRHLRDEREQLRLLNVSRLSFSADDEQPGALQHHSGQPEKAASPAPGAADPQPKSMPETAPGTERTDSIATSKWRPNVLHDYEPDYRQTDGYIYFKGNTISYSGIDTYFDTDPACRLALAVPHDMSHDGYLLLGFDGEKAQRIPLYEIFSKGENTEIPLWNEDRLMFAAIAAKDDIVLCVFADSGDSLWSRAVRLQQIESAHLNSIPRKIHDGSTDHTFAWEVACPQAESSLADSLADNLGTRRTGYTLRVKEGTPRVADKMEELIKKCQPNF